MNSMHEASPAGRSGFCRHGGHGATHWQHYATAFLVFLVFPVQFIQLEPPPSSFLLPEMAAFYSITEILNVARIHPFYNPSCAYPPSPQAIAHARKSDKGHVGPQLAEQPLLHKDQLYPSTLGTY